MIASLIIPPLPGKTAVFVISTLQQLEPVAGQVGVIVLCHTRELAYQIKNEYARFSKYLPDVRTSVFYGGTSQKSDTETLKNKDTCPHVVVATPGRLNALVRDKSLNASNVKNFVLDECDKLLDTVGQSLLLSLSHGLASALWRPFGVLCRPRLVEGSQ